MSNCKIETGARMFKLRKQQGRSQAEVAKYLQLTVAAYQNYEAGRREAGYEVLAKLADFYGVTVDYLLGREEKVNPFMALNLNVKLDNDKFIELYSELPDEVKQVFVDTMAKLSQAIQHPHSIRKQTTCTCGELEDIKKAEQEEGKDAG